MPRPSVKPTPRLSLAFAVAVLLHLVVALLLPDLRDRLIATVAPGLAKKPAAAVPGPRTPTGLTIPIHLPQGGLRMDSRLGAVGHADDSKIIALKAIPPALKDEMELSASLQSAAREAQAAYERQNPSPAPQQTTRLVAELHLAGDGGVRVASPQPPSPPTTTPKPPPSSPPRAESPKPVSPIRPTHRRPEPEPVTRPIAPAEDSSLADAIARAARAAAAAPVTLPPPQPRPLPVPAAAPTPAPAPPATDAGHAVASGPAPIRPQGYLPVQPFRGVGPEHIAEAPPLPPAQAEAPSSGPLTAGNALLLGAQAAPDRGPGPPSGGRGMFFQQLTNHLYSVNQLVLSEALRATPKLTVVVGFAIDREGRVLGAQVSPSTGNPALDRKAVDMIMRASPMPQLAPDMPQQRLELSFPVQIYR